MAPEQATGAVDQIDARSDVFGLGGILCAILTGDPPFVAGSPISTRRLAAEGQVEAAFDRLDACGTEPELVSLCKWCLTPNRGDRPANAGVVAKAVESLRLAAEERARQAELDRVRAEGERAKAEVRVAEQRKRRKVQLALFAAVALLGTGGGAFAWWQDRQASDRRTSEALLAGERDTEQRLKAEQAHRGVATNLQLAADLRSKYRFRAAEAALKQAEELAPGAPELVPLVRRAIVDLAFVVQLDDIRYRKWMMSVATGGEGSYGEKAAPAQYRKAFADRGMDLTSLEPKAAGDRIAASPVKGELVEAVDDWAMHEQDPVLRDRLLAVARTADPGPWTDRLRDAALWTDRDTLAKLARACKESCVR